MIEPVAEIYESAGLLEAALFAHLSGDTTRAEGLIRRADKPEIRVWTESLWGKGGPWSRPLFADPLVSHVAREVRHTMRMPTTVEKAALLARDGYQCRFCGIPLIRRETRNAFQRLYPSTATWGSRNVDQHAALQAMWLQYDHLIPHARGGPNDVDNIVVSCAPCNKGRSNLTLDEVGVADPRLRPPIRAMWGGREAIHRSSKLKFAIGKTETA